MHVFWQACVVEYVMCGVCYLYNYILFTSIFYNYKCIGFMSCYSSSDVILTTLYG